MSRHYEISDDDHHRPLTWVQGHPLYATHLIVAALGLTIFATAIVLGSGAASSIETLVFDGAKLLNGEAWRVLTYGLVNYPSLSIAIDLLLLFWFGREVEKHLGRRSFLRLYLFLYLIPPLLLSALAVWAPLNLAGQTGALAVFVAFATLYPSATVVLNLAASWAAAALVAIFTLVAIASRDWAGLVALWSTTAYAHAFIRHSQGRLTLGLPRLPSVLHRSPQPRPRPSSAPLPTHPVKSHRGPGPATPPADDMAEVDRLLDKISRSGLQSLTPPELERLSAAQARLARRLDRPTV